MVVTTADAALYPDVLGGSANGSAVDWGIGTPGSAIQQVGDASDGINLASKLQESTTGLGSWTDIAGGAFTDVTGSFHVQILVFTPTKRYIRWTGTITGESPSIGVAVVVVR